MNLLTRIKSNGIKVFLAFGLISLAFAQTDVLTVGVKDAPPFVIPDGQGGYTGISIDLWTALANDLGLEYQLEERNLIDLLNSVASAELDVGIAAITITEERETNLDFSHAYYDTGLGIATLGRTGGLGRILGALFSPELLVAVLALCALLLAVGFFMWLAERRSNPEEFGTNWLRGLGEGFWWSAVTMTTVGYGDRSPKTLAGRMLALIWMFASLILLGAFIAAFTAAITVSGLEPQIQSLADLRGATVATLRGATSETFLTGERLNYVSYDSVQDALDAVAAGRADAAVHDVSLLHYLVTNNPQSDLVVLDEMFDPQSYGIALPTGSVLREDINLSLLELTRSPRWQEMLADYLGSD